MINSQRKQIEKILVHIAVHSSVGDENSYDWLEKPIDYLLTLQDKNAEEKVKKIEDAILERGKCPACTAGFMLHRNCIMR